VLKLTWLQVERKVFPGNLRLVMLPIIAHSNAMELKHTLQQLSDYRSQCEEAYAMKQIYETEIGKKESAAKVFEVENHRLQSDIERLKNDLSASQSKLAEARKTVTAMTLAYKNSLRDMSKFENKETIMVNELKELEAQTDGIESISFEP